MPDIMNNNECKQNKKGKMLLGCICCCCCCFMSVELCIDRNKSSVREEQNFEQNMRIKGGNKQY